MKASASLLLLLPLPAAHSLRRSGGLPPPLRGLRPSTSQFATIDDDGRCTFAFPPACGRSLHCSPSTLHERTATSTTAVRAAPAGRTGALFPSDDSDYFEQAANNNGGVATVHHEDLSEAAGEATTTDFVLVDPVDAIADRISEWFVAQSLQKRADAEGNDGSASETNGNANGSSDYVMERYAPGSALDALARATQTYTPLSYQMRTVVRVVAPSLVVAALATAIYPSLARWLVHLHTPTNGEDLYTDQVLVVLSNDLSQYVQNVLTTCALLFGMLVGQTYYFMYQQQELVFYALFAEVTEAKSLLEQISLLSYGRPGLYPSLLARMDDYVHNDLKVLSTRDPIATTSRLPRDDPLESILYATSVGLPGSAYETVKSLRQARADRCGALQRKLPALHVYCLRLLGVIVLATFPVCGSGSQAIAPNVLILQSYMFGILAFGLTLVLNVVEELRDSRKRGAYNVDGILEVMVGGLERELEERLEGNFWGVGVSPGLPGRGNVLGEASIGEDAELKDGGDSADNSRPSRTRRIKKWLGKVRRR